MAIFELEANGYVEHVWFAGREGIDVLAMLYRHDADAPMVLRVRSRVHNSPDPDDPEDRKRVYDVTPRNPDTAAQELAFKMETLMGMLRGLGWQTWSVPVRGGNEELQRALAPMPWAHSRVSAPGPKRPQ